VLQTVKRQQLNLTRSTSQEGSDETLFAWRAVLKESMEMFRNRDFVILFVAFSINFGILNALLTVFNQLLSPHGYRSVFADICHAKLTLPPLLLLRFIFLSNSDAGTVAAICIVTGLVGSALAGYLMEKTQAYRRILKAGAFVCFWAAVLFMCMLYQDNFWPLLISAAVLGAFFRRVADFLLFICFPPQGSSLCRCCP
jgi:MFS family permease